MAYLFRQRTRVLLAICHIFRWQWTRPESAIAAVVANPCVVDDGYIVDVDIPYHRLIHPGNGAVIHECIVVPIPADVAYADVAEAIIYAAIEADVRSPVAVMPSVTAAVEAPIAGGP
jgi:hypothetical protein